MILRRLELRNCGRFAEYSVEFRRGMNLVHGPNESGKSTLMEAIPAVLFGVRQKEKFRTWGRSAPSSALLVLEEGGRTISIERDILEDRVQVVEHDEAGRVHSSFEGKASPLGRSAERSEYLELLQQLLGIADEEVFRASLFFGQGNLELSGPGIAGKLKSLLSGFVEVDYDRVLQSLQHDHFEITRQNPWGKDKTRDRELDEVRRRLEEMEGRWFAAQGALQEMQALQRQMTALEEGIERDRGEFAKGERYLAWVRRQWQLEEKEEGLRRDFSRVSRQSEKVAELERERQGLEKEIARTGLPRQLPPELPGLLAEAEEIRRELVEMQKEATGLRQELVAHANPRWKQWALLTVLLLAIASVLGWFRPSLLLAGVGGGVMIVAVIWAAYLWRALRERRERTRINSRSEALEERREEVQARLEGVADRIERLGLAASAVEIARMQKNLPRQREMAERLREIDSALQVLEKSDALAGEKEELTRKLAVLDERLERERPLRSDVILSPEELPEAEEKLAALGGSLREREKQLLELARREAGLQGELGNLSEIEEEGERLRERERRLDRRRQALAAGYDLLAGAVDEFRRTYLDRFATEAGHYLQMVSNGRYEAIRLDESFAVHLQDRQGGEWHPVEEFSRGTIDALYLAARLALTRHLARGRSLPLLLDDPLVNLDHFRLSEVLHLLERLGGEHQVILFSHDETLARRSGRDRWHLISIERESVPRAREERSEHAGQLYLL